MKKFLDILLVFSITFLIFSLFLSPKQDEQRNELNIIFEKNSYTIPASIKILVQNHTSSGFIIDTCRDISISKSGERIEFSPEFCEEREIKAGEVVALDYSGDFALFDKTGQYTLEVVLQDGKKFIDKFELENRGMFGKLFVWLIYAPVYNLFVFLIKLFSSSFGWAVVALTVILKLLLFYPQQKMMVGQRKIQELQPKIKKIQEEFKGDQQVLGQKLMELYSKEKVNPMGSCGFLLIQMPILLVVYNVIYRFQNHTNEYYMYSSLNGFSIHNIDFNFFGLDLLSSKGTQGIILALIVAGIQFIQIKISLPKKKEEEKGVVLEKKEDKKEYSAMPNPEVMNKFMLYGMPVMVGVFTYSWFAAIGLYWGISTFLTLLQNLLINKNLNK